jgi:chaperonin GroES
MENKSGIQPVEFKVLILPDSVKERTAGGIILPEMMKDKEQMAQVKGQIVAVGGDAFADWKDAPVPGMRVYFGKYAGYMVTGEDGQEYRLVNDKDLVAVIN